MNQEQRELTYGEKAVGKAFNPTGNLEVDSIKLEFANIINRLNDMRANAVNPEVTRMLCIAITDAQTAQMWAVKAATWQF